MSELLSRAEKYTVSQDLLTQALEEQTYDIRMDLNNVLLMFCQVRME